jgi:hypothetical protein
MGEGLHTSPPHCQGTTPPDFFRPRGRLRPPSVGPPKGALAGAELDGGRFAYLPPPCRGTTPPDRFRPHGRLRPPFIGPPKGAGRSRARWGRLAYLPPSLTRDDSFRSITAPRPWPLCHGWLCVADVKDLERPLLIWHRAVASMMDAGAACFFFFAAPVPGAAAANAAAPPHV